MPPNPGHLPEECILTDPETGEVTGYRMVNVILFNGWDSRKAGSGPWPARDGRPPTNWSIRRPDPHPFDIKEFEPQ